jgi:hypothetical protein
MPRNSKDAEIRKVVADADALMDQLRANVDALQAILLTPPPDPDAAGKELTQS